MSYPPNSASGGGVLHSATAEVANSMFPYRGDWSLASWNTQGLVASDVLRQQVKMRRAGRLAGSHDLLAPQEMHGNSGKCAGLGKKPRPGNSTQSPNRM